VVLVSFQALGLNIPLSADVSVTNLQSGVGSRFASGSGNRQPSTTTSPSRNHVRFIRSFTDAEKRQLLKECTAVVYTPSHEHFGIVPLETMASVRPVIAVNNGGPLETVVNKETGFLCEPSAKVAE
jgi:glycosyltransferase involved in cell wall biosynthesis